LRQQYSFWLHVDGAWGGAAVLSPKLQNEFLPGLADADSFTLDFHKMPGTALMCNVLLLNRSDRTLGRVLSAGDGSYLFREEEGGAQEDLGLVSLQCGRKVDSLKWFLDWQYFGRQGFASRIENNLALCHYAEELVQRSPELELIVPRTSFNICFCYKM
jgi:glutamate/tyrosine decarboxylase-like PLP-dependent enzyme